MSTAAATEVALPSGISAAPFALVTPFSAPAGCAVSAGGFTMLQNDGYRIWLNAILPIPGTTMTSCYPTEFISSYLLERGGIPQVAFSPLVCPSGYSTVVPYTSNYIACCPSGWGGLATASDAPSDRPAGGGTCYTNIYNIPIKITAYDDTSIQASSIFTATNSLDQAFAMVYEGFASGVAVLKGTTFSQAISSQTPSSIPSSTSAPPTATSSPSTVPVANVSTSAVVGIIFGIVIGIALIIAAIFRMCCRRQRQETEEPDHPPKVPPKHGPWDEYWISQMSGIELNQGGYSAVKQTHYNSQELPGRSNRPELDGRGRTFEMG